MRRGLPELPHQRRQRMVSAFGLTDYDAGVLTSQKELVDYFEAGLGSLESSKRKLCAKPLVNWMTTELLGRLNADKKDIADSPIKAEALASGKVSSDHRALDWAGGFVSCYGFCPATYPT